MCVHLEDVDDHGGEVAEEEDHDDAEQHAGQPQLPRLGAAADREYTGASEDLLRNTRLTCLLGSRVIHIPAQPR